METTGRPAETDRADRGLREGAGPLPHRRRPRSRVRRGPRARPVHGGPEPRRPAPAAGSRGRSGSVADEFRSTFTDGLVANGAGPHYTPVEVSLEGERFPLQTGSVAIAAITSCTNTSNPSVMVGAGLLAKKAVERGLTTPPWVKTSLAPGSRAVTVYLDRAGLTPFLDELRLRPGGLRLHHLHRQLGAAGRADRAGHRAERPRRRGGALGQPQLRGPHPPPHPRQLPGLAAAGRGLRPRRPGGHRPHHRAARRGLGRRAGLPRRHLADLRGDRRG